MTSKEKIIELYNNAYSKEIASEHEVIRQKFFKEYGPDALKSIDGEGLAIRLFANKSNDSDSVERGLFSWLEHGGSYAKKGAFGYARDSAFQYGILLKEDGKYMNHRQGKATIELTEEEAISYANAVREFICAAYALIENATLETEEDYKAVDKQLQDLCKKEQSPYWTERGDLKQSLLKYLHIAFPNKVCEFYSPNYLQKVANELGLSNFGKNAAKFYKNGQIMLYIKGIDAAGDSVRFARAVNPLVYKKKIKESDDSEFEIAATAEDEEEQNEMNKTGALNTILYGPPGTGKTYHTVIKAVKIIEGVKFQDDGYPNIKKRYDKYMKDGRIYFTTFHQSYGYEEFIEGIKPISDDTESGDIKYKIESGVFKKFCDNAKKLTNDLAQYGTDNSSTVWKVSLGRAEDKDIKKDCFDKDRIRIGWGDDCKDIEDEDDYYGNGKSIVNAFIFKMKKGDIVLSRASTTTIDAIGVILEDECRWDESYSRYKRYRKVKWLRKNISVDIKKLNDNNKMVQATVYKLNITIDNILAMLNQNNNGETVEEYDYSEPYVFIIDEINRGNVSKIFGELITLIEPTKRLGADEAMKCRLPYSKQEFGVPKNVYILGTMNTADRSLVQLDAALRRRFEFEERMPDYGVIEKEVGEVYGINISEMLRAMNERICVLLDREHQIGHSYFLKLKKGGGKTELASIFKNSIIPLLQEYFFDDYEMIRKVLGENDFIIEKSGSKYLWNLDSAKKVYEINTDKNVFENEKQYMRIYDKLTAVDNVADE